ncbi:MULTISPECIES: hypothetical protein [unclassified Serratia (in: enterobacteria)]|uniref:hypothetical protein n=1 Tax=unclassified Serratia (in: enterobacteria) TaxID=2647522 RepID=UPI000502DA84|nr:MULTISPECIES: hypothetical protein [unclassified Serratia (in: enterobacteria)]KFK95055.1 hypothetical protein IV04_21665 [Serratia sp. Ag1]KFK96015.1 hypothetical protein JV45_06355 [Serratia sp. Ag2]
MSERINLIEINRRRIITAYLGFCQGHYGGGWADIVLPKNNVVRVYVTQKSLEQCMVSLIEHPGYEEFGRQAGNTHITTLYHGMLTCKHKLTALGTTVMEEMMKAAVSDALENPGKSTLQVVH